MTDSTTTTTTTITTTITTTAKKITVIGVTLVALGCGSTRLSEAECNALTAEAMDTFTSLSTAAFAGEPVDPADEARLTEIQQTLHDGECQAPAGNIVPAPSEDDPS